MTTVCDGVIDTAIRMGYYVFMDPEWIIAGAIFNAVLTEAGAIVNSLVALRTPKHRLILSLYENTAI